jgi:hypothetical protein
MRSKNSTRIHPRLAIIVFLVVSILLIPIFSSAEAACIEDPTAFWQLEEDPAPYSDSIGALSATCSGSAPTECPTQTTSGVVGNALVFNDSSTGLDIAAANPATRPFDWAVTDSFSIEVWFKTAAAAPLSSTMVAVGRVHESTINLKWFVGVDASTGFAVSRVVDRADNGDAAEDELLGSTNLTDGGPHHVVVTRDASTGKIYLYVDGVLEDSTSVNYTDGFTSQTNPMNIGYLNRVSSKFHFNGTIDEVAIYGSALTPEIVKSHFDNGSVNQTYCADVAPAVLLEPEMNIGFVGYAYEGNFMASGNPTPTFTLGSNPPTGLTIADANTGEIDWLPLDNQWPSVDVEVTAQNSVDFDTNTVSIDLYDLCGDFQPALWGLDESATPFTDSVGGLLATCSGTAPTECPTSNTTDAILSNSLAFSPVDETGLDVASGGATVFDWAQTDSFSVEAWVKPAASLSGTQVAVGRVHEATISLRWWLGVKQDGSAAAQVIDRDGTGGSIELVDSRPSPSDLRDRWALIGLVRDAATNQIRLYVDGELADSETVVYTSGFNSGSNPLNIGYLNRVSSKFHFTGLIDEVALYDAALTASVFATHYQNGLIGKGYCNTAPTFGTPAPNPVPTTATEEQLYTVDFNVNDVDPDTLTLTLANAPTGMSINGSGVVTWIPDDPIVSPVSYTVQVSDNAGGTNSQQYDITVTAVNDPPVIASQNGTLTTEEETALEITIADVNYSDVDSTSGFSLGVQGGTNYTVAGNTITPVAGFIGNLTVPVTVSDGTDSSTPFNLTVEVTEPATGGGGGGGGGGCFINAILR